MEAPALPILYSFRRCPYAMRARMSILSAGIRCELREVVLREKPAEMISISPKATVPVLELLDGTIIDESIDIMKWALTQRDPENWLKPSNSKLNGALSFVGETEIQFKSHLDRYKYPNRYDDSNPIQHRTECCKFIAQLETKLAKTPYLFGADVCIADIAVFPFIRQFANTDRNWFNNLPYRHTQKWLDKLLKGKLFDIAMKKYPQWQSGNNLVFFPE